MNEEKDIKYPEDCASTEDIRQAIDALDREIVALVGHRARYVEAAAKFKTSESDVQAPERQRTMIEVRRKWAVEENLPPELISEVYNVLVSHFVSRELNGWKDSQGAD